MLRILSILIVLPLFAHADSDLFQKGLAAYQSQHYQEAHDDFQKLLSEGHVNAGLLHNLALTAYQMDQKPLALAIWRKALAMEPGYRPAREGRDLLEKKMQMRPLERDSFGLWQHRGLERLPLVLILLLNALVLALCSWLWLHYFGERLNALEEERALPSFPVWGSVCAVLLLGSLFLSGVKIFDTLTERATITSSKANARSLPTNDSVSLFEVSGGNEVLVRRTQGDWTQIQTGDGSSGWLPNTDLLVTSGR